MDLILLFKAFILGIVEGATEFLPISSTGHQIVVSDLLDFGGDKSKVFIIVIQLGAILAVCWEYRQKLFNLATNIDQPDAQRFVSNIALAFLPAAILGLIFHDAIKTYLFSPLTVAIALIVGGFIILAVERWKPVEDTPTVDDMDWKHALKIGIAQSCALMPGVSRAGATILGGVVFGLSRKAATEFSFFLAIPIMFAATCYDLFKSRDLLNGHDFGMFAVGFVTAFLAALVAIKTLLRYVAKHDFRVFAWYRIIFGSIVLLYIWNR